jgi:acetolactate synthase-1/2/3 large subunit
MNAPVVTTELGRSAFPEDHPLSVGYHWGHAVPFRPLLEECDLLLAIGTDLGEKVGLGSQIPLPPSLMHLDIRKEVIGRHFPVGLGLVGDAAEVLPRIVRELGHCKPTPKSDKCGPLRKARASAASRLAKRGPLEYALARALRHTLPRDAIVTVDAAAFNNWLIHAYTVCEPRTFFSPSCAGTLGFAFPAALGAKAACPQRAVVAVVGDGGFLFTAQELATARKYGLNLIVLLFNDAEFGTIRYLQERDHRGRVIDVALCNPDFLDFSKSFGCEAVRVRDAESLRAALLQAMKASAPTVIEIPIAVRYPAWVEE